MEADGVVGNWRKQVEAFRTRGEGEKLQIHTPSSFGVDKLELRAFCSGATLAAAVESNASSRAGESNAHMQGPWPIDFSF